MRKTALLILGTLVMLAVRSVGLAVESPMVVRAHALEILRRAGCIAHAPELLGSAAAIVALKEERGNEGVRAAFGCDGKEPAGASPHTAAVESSVDASDSAARAAAVEVSTPAPSASPSPSPQPSGSPGPQRKKDLMFGKSVETDYTAKHFTFITGAAVLNRFKIDEDTVTGEDGKAKDVFRLKPGSTTARVFLEGGFRYRWAWLDRLSARDRVLADTAQTEAAHQYRKLYRLMTEAEDLGSDVGSIADSALRPSSRDYETRLQKDTEAGVRVAKAEWVAATSEGSLVVHSLCERWATRTHVGFFLPDDWTARLGFVFDGDDDDATAGVPGVSDLYGELGTGWNLVWWTFPTDFESTPIRGALSLELALAMTSDGAFNDIHQRYFGGLSTSFGVPIKWVKKTDAATDGSRKPLGAEPPTADPVVEFVTRVGAVRAEIPIFDDDDNDLIEQKHGQPDFGGKWGFGFDLELNVPVPNDLGYLIARGNFAAGFDPNPWTLQIGYTVPIGKVVSGLGGED